MVKGFVRYHKYTVSNDLLSQVMVMCRRLSQALLQKGQQRLAAVEQLIIDIDDIKVFIQLAKAIKAFQNFRCLFPFAHVSIEKGWQTEHWSPFAAKQAQPGYNSLLNQVVAVKVSQQGYLSGGLKRRCFYHLPLNSGVALCGL